MSTIALRGIGVIDTTSLFATASLLEGDISPDNQEYFLSLAHNLILYDELRTDFDILQKEDAFYSHLVNKIVSHLDATVKITAMPASINDEDTIHAISGVFVENVRRRKRSHALHAYYGREHYGQAILARRIAHAAIAALRESSIAALREHVTPQDAQQVIDEEDRVLVDLSRELTITARTVRYMCHSNFLQKQEGVPSAFCALPKRIDLLRGYVDHQAITKSKRAVEAHMDLFSGLPKTGYDFSSVVSKPLPLSDLSQALKGLPAAEALDRVLEIRNTDAANEVRQAWADRLWAGGAHAVRAIVRVSKFAM